MIRFPFTTLQQCNLDWLMQQLNKILDFLPQNGSSGEVLQRTADGAAWMPIPAVSLDIHGLTTISDVSPADELAIYDNSMQGNYKVAVSDLLDIAAAVTSVNGQTGDVILTAADVNALPDSTVIPTDTSDLTNTAGFVNAAGAAAAAPVQSVNGMTGAVTVPGSNIYSVNGKVGSVVLDKTDIGLGNVDNVQQYSASNPPPYPVTSVNGQTGAVTVASGSMTFGTGAEFTVTRYAGIGSVVDSDLFYRLSSDGKFIMIWGWVELSFSTTGDYTILELTGPTITGYNDTVSYANSTALFINSNGNIDFLPSKSGGFARNGNQLRLICWYPSNTGTYRAMVPCQMFALDA